MLRKVSFEKSVDRVEREERVRAGGDLALGRFQIDRGEAAEADPRRPGQSLVNPRAQHADLLPCQLGAFLRHHIVRVQPGNQLNQIALGAVAQHHCRPGIAPFEQRIPIIDTEPALALASAVALDAARLEDGLHLLRKIDRVGRGPRQLL